MLHHNHLRGRPLQLLWRQLCLLCACAITGEHHQIPLGYGVFRGAETRTGAVRFSLPLSGKKKAYTTTTERKSFGELFWLQRKTFQASGGYKNPIKTRKTISTTEIFPLWTPFFSAKKSSALEQGGVCFLFPRLWTKKIHF